MKAGVIGVGTMGYGYAKILKKLRGIELVGLVDNNDKTLESVSKDFKVNAYNNAEEFFIKEKPDFIVISCPDEYHAKYALMALERDINIHLEKPVADTLESCYEILGVSKKSKSKLNIGYILRTLPQYHQIKQSCDAKKFGDIIHFYSRRNGTIDQGLRWQGRTDLSTYLICHDADIFMWITGLKIDRVYGEETVRNLKHFNTHDSIQVVFKASDKSIGVFECSWALPQNCNFSIDNRMELIGTKEAAFINLQDQGIHFYTEKGIVWNDMIFGGEIQNNFIIGALKNEVELFIDSIINDRKVMCSVEEGIEASKVAIATKLSIEKGEIVYLKDIE